MIFIDYAKCQRAFAQTLVDFKFETIGSQQTDEEIIISKSQRMMSCVTLVWYTGQYLYWYYVGDISVIISIGQS